MSLSSTTAVAASAVTVSFEDPSEEWDEFVQGQAGATFSHLSGWATVLSETLRCSPYFLAARTEEGDLRGVLPLYRVKSRLTGDRLFSVPFLNGGGPLGDDEAREALAMAAVRLSKDLGVSLLELRSDTDAPGLHRSDRKITVTLDLPEDSETLWKKGLKAKLRSQVRRPSKEGMEFHEGTEHIDAFYDVFAQNMRDLGTPVLPLRFFERIAAVFPDQVIVGVVKTKDGITVAGGFGLAFQGEFEITWASSLRSFNRFSPNMLLYWGMLETCIERSVRVFNFGRCSPDSPTHRFKMQWGGEASPLPWARWQPGGISDDSGYGDSGLMNTASRFWTKMPLSAANRFGPWLARHLP